MKTSRLRPISAKKMNKDQDQNLLSGKTEKESTASTTDPHLTHYRSREMGEYWKAVNVDKRQMVHPHQLNNGLKWPEWVTYESATQKRIKELIERGDWKDDEIRAVSDYGGTAPLYGPVTERPAEYDESWEDVSLDSP